MMIGCESWTVEKDYGGDGDLPAYTVTNLEDCHSECIQDVDCTAIDWIADSTECRCWLVGPWTTWSGDVPGSQRHTINRACR